MSKLKLKAIEPETPDGVDADSLSSMARDGVTNRAAFERVCFSQPDNHVPIRASSVSLDQSLIKNNAFAGSSITSLAIADCVFDHADLAGATWVGSRIVRARFEACKLTGFDLRLAELRDVLFTQCKVPDALLGESKLTRVVFDGCQLENLDLGGAVMESLVIRNCRATNLRLVGAQISYLDLRSSEIDGVSIDAQSLKSVIIDPMQSSAMVTAIGGTVADRSY